MRTTVMFILAGASRGAFHGSPAHYSAAIARGGQTLRLFAKAPRVAAAGGGGEAASSFWEARTECWRPTVNDVERISWGKPAKKKGTGSRGTPHRLNQDERLWFDQARRRGFLEVPGSGWRSRRREAPLLNSYRSLCDARGQACIVLHKGNTGMDELVLDLSPLRLPDSFAEVAETCVEQLAIPTVTLLGDGDEDDIEEPEEEVSGEDPWESRPIYQLPPYFISWELQRSEAKAAGKKLAGLFRTAEPKAAKSRKPVGVKHGKGRRHGGYGIG